MNKYFIILFFLAVTIVMAGNVKGLVSPTYDYSGYDRHFTGSSLVYDSSTQSFFCDKSTGCMLTSTFVYEFHNFTTEFTWSGVNPDFVNQPNSQLVFWSNTTSYKILDAYLVRNVSHAAYGQVVVVTRNATGSTRTLTTGSFFKNQTNFITFTLVMNSTSMSLYINGIYNISIDIQQGIYIYNISTVKYLAGNGLFLNGSMRNIKIWNVALNATNVLDSYNNNTVLPNNMVGYWKTIDNGCFAPKMNHTELITFGSIDLCGGIYINSSIQYQANNSVLNCNGSTFLGLGNGSDNNWAISIDKYGNETIEYCNINNYDSGIFLTDYNLSGGLLYNSKVIYNNLTLCNGVAGIYVDGQSDFSIHDNRLINFGDNGQGNLGSHAIYLASNTLYPMQGGEVYNNYISNISATGIKINPQNFPIRNLKIFNNQILNLNPSRGDDIGIHIADASNISVYNNIMSGGYDTGLYFNHGENLSNHANNNYVYNNTFNGLDIGIQAVNYTHDNFIHDNNFLNNIEDIRIKEMANISLYELDMLSVYYYLNSRILTLNGSVYKNFTINSFELHLFNFLSSYPFNDVYNVSNGVVLVSNVDNYSISLSAGQQIIVDDYTCAKHYIDSGIAYSCNATSCYFTNTNCTFKTGRTS